jgi:hypothetical protein
MIARKSFLDLLWNWKDHDLIKVVTGVRRCGKSTVLEAFAERLMAEGVPREAVLRMDFESEELDGMQGVGEARAWLAARRPKGMRTYVILDEVQRLPEFERLVDGLHHRGDTDVYVTGSNARLLSGELATHLSGRYVELPLQPLSFREFCEGTGRDPDAPATWRDFTRFGAFPYVQALGGDPVLVDGYLEGLYNTVLVRDILQRSGISDAARLHRVARYLFDNVGNLTSVAKIADTLTSAGAKTAYNTVDAYVEALCAAYLFRRAERFDVKGRELLKSGGKYYAVDTGLRGTVLSHRAGDAGRVLENVVFNELVRRWRGVFIGKFGAGEIDFVARDGGETAYYQVAETLRGPGILERELAPLRAVDDNFPKTVITLDPIPRSTENGIVCMNAIDFLLSR